MSSTYPETYRGVATVSTAGEFPDTAPTVSAVSWSAVIAGAMVMVVTMLVLLTLGTGIGLSAVSPWPGAGASLTTIGVSAVIWWVVVQWLASGLGGYLAGRLRTKWVRVHTHEVFFRDTVHGFLAWSLATVVGAVMLGAVTAASIGAGVRGASDIGAAATSAAVNAGGGNLGLGYVVDTMFRASNPAPADSTANLRGETVRILTKSVQDGQIVLAPADRTYMAQMVAARAGVTQAEATQRVDSAVTQLNRADAQLRAAADQVRKQTAHLSIAAALALVIGAFVASAAGALGGSLRDD
jgi:hypothetical protein